MQKSNWPTWPKTPSIEDVIKLFLLDGRARQFTPATLAHYRTRLTDFARFAATENVTHVGDITPTLLRAYLVYLRDDRKLASNTQHTHARAVRTFLNFAKAEDMIPVSPFAKVKMPRADVVAKPAFDAADVRRLLKACQTARERALVLFLLDTGVRVTELCDLHVADVDIDRLTVLVQRGKGRKARTVYIGSKTALQIRRYLMERGELRADAPLFASETSNKHGAQLTRWGASKILRRIGDAAGVRHCHPHTFRRTFALWSLRAGMDIYRLAMLMGHADTETLKRYLAIVDADLRQAHDDAGPVDKFLK